MFTVPVGGCSRVEDVFFSGQQRQAVRVQVNRSHHDAAVFLCTPQTSALQHTFCVTSKQAVPVSKVAFSEFGRRCVTSEGEGLLELEVARRTLLLCISPAGNFMKRNLSKSSTSCSEGEKHHCCCTISVYLGCCKYELQTVVCTVTLKQLGGN